MRCPKCSSQKVKDVRYDFGAESQTGYRDAGEFFQCMECGETLTEEEVLQMLADVMLGEAEIELATREESSSLFVLAMAGCSLQEAAALMANEKRWRN